MSVSPSPSLKRSRENEDESTTPPRKRCSPGSSPVPRAASPSYNLVERPARRYSRGDESDTGDAYYGDHRTTRAISRHRSRSKESRPRSRSRSRRRSSPPPPTPKPTALHYKQTFILHGHKKGVTAVKFSPDGKWIASASADCTIKIWDSQTGRLEHTMEGHLAGVNAISWSPDSTMLASGSDDKTIRLWIISTGLAHPRTFTGHHNYVFSIAFSPKGNMLVSGSYDESLMVWDVRSGRIMKTLPAHSDPIGGVDFVRDGTLIVSCGNDGLIRVWDTATGQCLRTLVHEDNKAVTSVRFSPNGKYILAWTLDSSMRLWNYIEGKGRCVKTYQGHQNTKYSLSGAFGTYGFPGQEQYAFIASGSEDNNIFLWDVRSKNMLQKLEGHESPVLSVDTHPTKQVIVSGGMDKTVRIWREGEATEQLSERTTNGDEGELPPNGTATESPPNGTDAELPPYPFGEDN